MLVMHKTKLRISSKLSIIKLDISNAIKAQPIRKMQFLGLGPPPKDALDQDGFSTVRKLNKMMSKTRFVPQ